MNDEKNVAAAKEDHRIIGEKIEELRKISSVFDENSLLKKKELLLDLGLKKNSKAKSIIDYHATLLFLCAYPQSPEVLELAQRELMRVATTVSKIYSGKNHTHKTQLENSGIANTRLNVAFSFDLVSWLVQTFPEQISLFSIDADAHLAEQVFCSCLLPVERELIAHKKLKPLQMIRRLRKKEKSDLKFLIELFDQAQLSAIVKDAMWDSLQIYITWTVKDGAPSLTSARSPLKNVFYHKTKLLKEVNWQKLISKPLQKTFTTPTSQKQKLVEVARGVLAMLLRETDTVTYADEKCVELFEMDRGIQIALFPMIVERRLPFESYIGYMAFKNSVPVAYGGGWIFLHRSKIGINVFPSFRGGESAFLFCQILRLYHHHFDVKKFVVEPYQIGKNNSEGLRSGAFWFYYRHGFVPVSPKLKQIASAEFSKVSADKTYRSPLNVMRKLAESNLELNLDPQSDFPDIDPMKVCTKTAEFVQYKFDGNRREASIWAMKKLLKEAGRDQRTIKKEVEKFSSFDLPLSVYSNAESLVLAKNKKSALLKLLQLKNEKKERKFILEMQKNGSLFL